jgi:hypothetical protein
MGSSRQTGCVHLDRIRRQVGQLFLGLGDEGVISGMLQENRCQRCLELQHIVPDILRRPQVVFDRKQCQVKIRDWNKPKDLHANPFSPDHGADRPGLIQTRTEILDQEGNLLGQIRNLGELYQVSNVIGKLLDTADRDDQHWLAGCILGRCLECGEEQRQGGTKDE